MPLFGYTKLPIQNYQTDNNTFINPINIPYNIASKNYEEMKNKIDKTINSSVNTNQFQKKI